MENMEIIEAIKSGDKEAIKTVYKDHAKEVYNLAKSITGDHDSAMAVTKQTFVNLFTNIQNGDEPVNIRLTALKLAYDEACRVTLPSSENIDSPFDREAAQEAPAEVKTEENAAETEEPAEAAEESEEPAQEQAEVQEEPAEQVQEAETQERELTPEETDGVIDTPYEFNEVMEESSEEVDITEAPEEGREVTPFQPPTNDIGNTQIFNIKDALENDEVIMDEETPEDYDEDEEDEDDDYEEVPRSKAATVIIIIVNIILVLILLWLVYGLVVSLGMISDVAHLGFTYEWFNNHIYQIF